MVRRVISGKPHHNEVTPSTGMAEQDNVAADSRDNSLVAAARAYVEAFSTHDAGRISGMMADVPVTGGCTEPLLYGVDL